MKLQRIINRTMDFLIPAIFYAVALALGVPLVLLFLQFIAFISGRVY